MSSFTAPLDLRHYPGRPTAVALLRELVWHSDDNGALTVTVPAGFVHDGASIRWWLRWMVSPHESSVVRAAAVHDVGYWRHGYDQREASRVEIDREFREALRVDEMGVVRRWLAWTAVRVGGWPSWRSSYRALHRIDHQLVAERNTILYALQVKEP